MRSLLLAAALLLPAAPAAAGDLPPELAGLEAEGEKWFQEAGKTDTSESKRNEARKNALVNLKKALDILNEHWDSNPGAQGALEDRIMKVGQMLYWVKKESPLQVLEAAGLAAKRATPAPAPPPAAPGGTPPAPPDSRNPFDNRPKPGPEAAPAAAPAADAPTLEKAYAAADAYARRHRADTAGILERFHEVMASFPEATGHPLFLKAAERAADANGRLKDVYRKLRDEDPDSIKNVDSGEVTRMLIVLGRELGSQDSAVRERAAKLLGMLGSGEAVYPLVKALKKEREEQALQAMGAAVVAIGGKKAADQLGGLRNEKDLDARALELLKAMTGRNPVDRRLALRELGAFALAKDETVADRAVDFLVGLGPEGAHGLVEALNTNNVETRIKVIGALGATKNPQVAKPLSNFLIGGDIPNTVRCKEAAIAAIKGLGEPAVPYLFHGLRNPRTKQWTAFLLREMTGQMYGSNRPGDWVDWWKRTHPDWKEGEE